MVRDERLKEQSRKIIARVEKDWGIFFIKVENPVIEKVAKHTICYIPKVVACVKSPVSMLCSPKEVRGKAVGVSSRNPRDPDDIVVGFSVAFRNALEAFAEKHFQKTMTVSTKIKP